MYLKDVKCMKTEVNTFSHEQEKDFPLFEWCFGKCPGLCTFFFKTSK